uniref:Microsomal glutathione S-transferase 3 n=1 Tax=Arion vulgaris TaxID=1028688 RepID=A0A0B7AIJ6_9EUPU
MPRIFDIYALPAVVTVVGIHQLVSFTKAVGEARKKYKVQDSDTTGPPEFIKIYRAHQNTLEIYPVSLTSLWIGSVFLHPVPASLLYAGFLIGRQKYFYGYVEDPENIVPGLTISRRCLRFLIILCTIGVGHKTIRYYAGDVFRVVYRDLKPSPERFIISLFL